MKRLAFFLFFYVGLTLVLNGQSPLNDPCWNTTPPIKFQDEFNGQNVGWNWAVWDPSWNGNNGVDFVFLQNNVSINNTISSGNGILELKALACPGCSVYGSLYNISSGSLYTGPYQYGFYESSCNMDCGGPNYMPSFWLQSGSSGPVPPPYYNEIDMEIRSGTPLYNLTTTNWYSANTPSPAATYTGNFSPSPGLQNSFHKYGIEWTPNHVVFYYDDVPFDAIWENIPSNPMRIIFTLGFVDAGVQGIHQANSFPGYEFVDYIRVYDLDNTFCSNDTTFSSPFQGNIYDFELRRYMTFAPNNNSVINSGNYVLRAEDFTIEGDFEVVDTDFTLLPTTCY